MTNTANPTLNHCSGCTKCCVTHPCALEPKDLANIARHLCLSEKELFNQFLVLDYVETAGLRQYYVAPARKADKAGRIVNQDWTFSESPCIFLNGTSCSIQQVKPKGGAAYYCRLLTSLGQERVSYSKKKSAADWSRTTILEELLKLAGGKRQNQTKLFPESDLGTTCSGAYHLPVNKLENHSITKYTRKNSNHQEHSGRFGQDRQVTLENYTARFAYSTSEDRP